MPGKTIPRAEDKHLRIPTKIDFDTIINHGHYVTGWARHTDPAGLVFKLKVNGQLAPVKRFGEEAVIQTLEVMPDSPLTDQMMACHAESALAFQRLHWHERIHTLFDLVDNADLDLLLDSDRLLSAWETAAKPMLTTTAQAEPTGQANPRLRLATQRILSRILRDQAEPEAPPPVLPLTGLPDGDPLVEDDPSGEGEEEEEIPENEEDLIIEIEAPVLEEGNDSPIYFKIDPTVPQGFSHIYILKGANSAWARVTAQAGDPDLYLYQHGALRAYSQSKSASDQVYAAGIAAKWRLHVYGCTTATYTLEGYWTRKA